jgi:hypothetical protein
VAPFAAARELVHRIKEYIGRHCLNHSPSGLPPRIR